MRLEWQNVRPTRVGGQICKASPKYRFLPRDRKGLKMSATLHADRRAVTVVEQQLPLGLLNFAAQIEMRRVPASHG